MKDALVFLNGEYTPLSQARVSVLDRGFVFGDGVYEVVPAYGRRLFRFDDHLARLARSLAQLRIANPATRDQWLERCRHLVAACAESTGAADQIAYLQVTRGVAPRDHAMPDDIAPTVFMMAGPLKPPSAEQRRLGVACVSAPDFRWARCDIKSTSLLGNVLARQISADQGAAETLLFRDGWLTEGSASNVWVVRDGALLGPPSGAHVLPGIRVGLLAELCAELGVTYALRPLSEALVRSADELLLSSATKEILPVTTLDGAPVGRGAACGRPGPLYGRLHAAYQRAKAEQSI